MESKTLVGPTITMFFLLGYAACDESIVYVDEEDTTTASFLKPFSFRACRLKSRYLPVQAGVGRILSRHTQMIVAMRYRSGGRP